MKSATKDEHYSFCGKKGHNKDGCFKKIGYPEWWLGKGKKEKGKYKSALADTTSSPIPGLTSEQYQKLVKHLNKEDKIMWLTWLVKSIKLVLRLLTQV